VRHPVILLVGSSWYVMPLRETMGAVFLLELRLAPPQQVRSGTASPL
jgi:hypothetical protein